MTKATMRLHEMPSPLLSLVAAVALARPALASFIPEFLRSFDDLQDVQKRCQNACGYYGQLCCQSNEACYTDANNQAQCTVVAAATTAAVQGSWQYYTTTYLETDLKTVTATFSSYVSQTTAAATATCAYSLGQTPCGNTCCLSGQYCQSAGTCAAVGGGSSGYYSNLYTVTTIVTNTASVALRPTSNTLVTVTSTGTPTTTVPFQTPSGTNGSNLTGISASTTSSGLSGGAIAGIVIGVIAAIIILLIICACCCAKGIIDGLLGIFGLGPRRKRRTETEEVYESHHSGGRPSRTWFGTRPSRPSRVDVVEEKSSGWGRGAGVAAFLGGLALILGLKRRRDRRDDKSGTGYGSSYYSGYTESSESSSDRRTRRSSRSRSRASRR